MQQWAVWTALFEMRAALYLPGLVLAILFIVSFLREPRQFRCGLYLFGAIGWVLFIAPLLFKNREAFAIIAFLSALILLFSACALLANGIIAIGKLGLSLTSLLPLGLSFALFGSCILLPFVFADETPMLLKWFVGWLLLEELWMSFSMLAFFLYSCLYRMFPRRMRYDYIIVHGAALRGIMPSNILIQRLNKAHRLWKRQGKQATIVVSGGKGSDEVASEASVMAAYLKNLGVPAASLLLEDTSTNTWENLVFSKKLIEAHRALDSLDKPASATKMVNDSMTTSEPGSAPISEITATPVLSETGVVLKHTTQKTPDYRCALVTSDFHVFRCAEYARLLGLPGDGIGSRTQGWYWPLAFIREFVALSVRHKLPYCLIALVCAGGLIASCF